MKKVCSFIIALCSLGMTAVAQQSGYKPGDAVTDFKLKNIDGKMVTLAGIKEAKGYIVVFTCNHCPYAKAYEDRIIALHHQFAPAGYPVVAINSNDPKAAPDDSYAKMQERAKEKKFPFVYLYDADQSVAKRFGAVRTPHVYLVQKNGDKMSVAYIGAIDDNWEDVAAVSKKYVEDAVTALQSGQALSVTETKAIGCTIKWKK
jgi:peroxiredoxin